LISYDQKHLNLIKTSLNTGSSTKLDVLAAERQLNNDQNLLPIVEQQAISAQHALALLLGKSPATWQAPVLDLNKFNLPDKLPIALPSEVIHQRPDILAAEAQWNASIAAVGVATANMYPNMEITASISQQSLTLASLFKASSTAWGVAGNVLQPIFAGGLLEAKRQSAIDAQQAMLAMYQQTILNAFCQIADLLHAVQNNDESLAIQKNNLAIAAENLNLINFKHTNGNAGILEVIEAKRVNCSAKIYLQGIVVQQLIDVAQLFLALGNNKSLSK
jgi:NodT family efflux transporter outer membrane factor (OMF) lipoprotein